VKINKKNIGFFNIKHLQNYVKYCTKKKYKINIIDDIEYLIESDFFNKHKGKLFQVEDYSYLLDEEVAAPLKPINISSARTNISIKSFDEFEYNNNTAFTLNDVQNLGLDLEDITNSDIFQTSKTSHETLKSGSSCSSRTSNTNEDELDELDEETNEYSSYNESKEADDDEESEYETVDEEAVLYATIPEFPVQIICLEHCEDTFDSLILNNELTDEEWFSALMQIIMILITYQKMFSFTHNDLHTNNIMYIPTTKKFIYYKYKKQVYKVPTYGRIFKIIDFGRSIYKFNGKIFCSDSFQTGNDAATQYNTEPYYDDSKPRLEPNFSFDLCRLACSIFDYIVPDFEVLKHLDNCSPIIRMIVEWCTDDDGRNILYKNNGVERYPDFKLYKMIARTVHYHNPKEQLNKEIFKKYLISGSLKMKDEKQGLVINIDELPIYTETI